MASKRFLRDDRGLVAIEWVSIAAVAFVAAFAIAGAVFVGVGDLGGAVANQMSAAGNQINNPN